MTCRPVAVEGRRPGTQLDGLAVLLEGLPVVPSLVQLVSLLLLLVSLAEKKMITGLIDISPGSGDNVQVQSE